MASCTSATCAFGCCQGNTCIQYADQTANVCGTSANTCASCGSLATCSVGQCVSTNPCAVNNGGCDTHATCAPTGGASRTCTCNPGYSGDGLTCSAADAGSPKWTLRMANRPDAGTTAPSPRRGVAMGYDAVNNLTLLFGGFDGVNNSGETWAWSGDAWSLLATTGPAPRRLAAIAYDSNRGQFVLFGGYDNTNALSDTWVWAGSAWTQVSVTGPGRYGAAMVYDAARDNYVMAGGVATGSANTTDTQVWNGSVWTAITGATLGGNISPPFVYDTVLAKPVLVATDSANTSQTLSLSNGVWSAQDAGTPPDRIGTAYGFIDGRLVVYGGELGLVFLSDTLEWDGARWVRVLSKGPAGRKWPGSAVEPARHVRRVAQ